MALTTFSGPVKSNNGFITGGAGSSVVLIADTALTVADHAGRNLLGFNATATITLPPIEDVGTRATNMLGTQFTIIVLLAATNLTINTDGVDKYVGAINVSAANSTAGKAFFPDGANDIITLTGLPKEVLLELCLDLRQLLTICTLLKVCHIALLVL